MLELTFGRLYEHIGSWQPPGNSTRLTCRRCFQTWLHTHPALAGLPHEILHPFIAELESYISRRYLELGDQDEAARTDAELDAETEEERVDRLAALAARAEGEVVEALFRREREVLAARRRLDVRLDDYLMAQVVRITDDPSDP